MKKTILIMAILMVLSISVKSQCSCECCSRNNITTLATIPTRSYWTSSGSFGLTLGKPKKPLWYEGFRLTTDGIKSDTVIRDFWKDTDTTTLKVINRKIDAIGFSTIEVGGKLAYYPINKTDSLSEVVNYLIGYTWKKSIVEVKGKLIKTIDPHLVQDEYSKKRDKTPVKYIYKGQEVIPIEIIYQTKRKPLD